jgi:ribosomal protein L23
MKKILLSLCLLVVSLFAKEGYVDVNVLLIKKDPSDASVKFGYYEKYEKITVVDMIDGIDNDDKWYLTNRGYVRAKYVILDEQLPKLLTPNEVDTTKNALQLAVYPKRAKNSLKDAIKKLMGEENVFVEETSKAKVLYLVNFPSYRAALNKLEEVPFKGFVTRMKLKSIEKVNTTAPVKKTNVW